MTLYQVRHLHGEENWSEGLRPAGGPGGGEPKNGDDHLCLPHGERHEEGVKETHTYTPTLTQDTYCTHTDVNLICELVLFFLSCSIHRLWNHLVKQTKILKLYIRINIWAFGFYSTPLEHHIE